MLENPAEILREYLKTRNREECFEQMMEYVHLVMKWNRVFNLTGFRRMQDFLFRGVIESLVIEEFIKPGSFVMDVGSGSGLPAVPVKILRPDIRLLMLEPRKKRWSFLQDVVRHLGLQDTRAIRQRVEDPAFGFVMKGALDAVTTRAFKEPPVFFNQVRKFLKKGGIAITFAGERFSWKDEERTDVRIHRYRLREGEICGSVVIFSV